MGTDGQNHAEKKHSKAVGEEASSDMFDLMKSGDSNPAKKELPDVGSGLSRFKAETGVDFFDLLNDKQLRAKFLVGKGECSEIEKDEQEIQEFFEPSQKKLIFGEGK